MREVLNTSNQNSEPSKGTRAGRRGFGEGNFEYFQIQTRHQVDLSRFTQNSKMAWYISKWQSFNLPHSVFNTMFNGWSLMPWSFPVSLSPPPPINIRHILYHKDFFFCTRTDHATTLLKEIPKVSQSKHFFGRYLQPKRRPDSRSWDIQESTPAPKQVSPCPGMSNRSI